MTSNFAEGNNSGCNEVLNSFVLLIEGDIHAPQIEMIELHIAACPQCEAELAHEQAIRVLMQDALRRSCNEKAPVDLHDAIYRQIHAQMAGTFTEVVTHVSVTEISIEIDEFGQVERHEVSIEHTEEISFINNDEPHNHENGQG